MASKEGYALVKPLLRFSVVQAEQDGFRSKTVKENKIHQAARSESRQFGMSHIRLEMLTLIARMHPIQEDRAGRPSSR